MVMLPFENFYITTPLQPSGVQLKLEEVVEPVENLMDDLLDEGAHKPFDGYAADGQFELKPNVVYRNSFIPQVTGATEPYENGSRVHIRMSLNPSVIIFIVLWMVAIVLFSIKILPQFITGTLLILVPALVIVLSYVLAIATFNYECKDLKIILLDLFDGEIE